jgi:aspartyl-tRNA(Asn)/glutamyl-tRNA(Gln) amidotransferase subunit A
MNRRDLCLGMAAGATQLALLSRSGAASAAALEKGAGDASRLSLTAASQAIRSGELTCVELTRACLGQIDARNKQINAVITTMRESALAQAAVLDAEASAGKFRSALHGIPIALKDNIDTAGTLTTNGSALQQDRVPAEDARVVQQLKQAGAIIIAKANMSEFALASATSASSFFGPVRNPWNPDYVSGGSSGGSGAAVASGMALGALGTDSGGSVRIPVAWCGLTGLKPTIGMVSFTGVGPTPPLLDTIGPMARTAEDVALLFTHMTGYDPLYSMSADRPREDYADGLSRSFANLRVGVPRSPYFEGLDEQVGKAVEAALAVIATLAGSVTNVTLKGAEPDQLPDLTAAMYDIYAGHGELLAQHRDDYQPLIRNALVSMGEEIDNQASGSTSAKLAHYIQSREATLRAQRTIDSTFDGFDVVVMPTIRILPYTLETARHSEYEGGPPLHSSIVANTMVFNILGLPALTVPCGFSPEGLPIGLQICGPRYSEGTLLALGAAYQRSTAWHERWPA